MARPGLNNHPKFRRLLLILKEPRSHVRGYLECLWDVAYENGDPVIGDAVDVELAAEYPGEQGRLYDALLAAGGSRPGFIEPVPGNPKLFQIHDLFDHAPEYVQHRATRESERKREKVCNGCGRQFRSPDPRALHCSSACRQAAWRDRRDNSNGRVTDRYVTVTDRNGTPAPAPAPAPREEDSTEPGCAPNSVPATEPADVSAILLTFPTVGGKRGNSREWHLRESYVNELRATYPHLDVLGECRKALAWTRANPGKHKTAGGMKAFLLRWLNKAQNFGNGRNGHAPVQRASVDRPVIHDAG
jgi:hypothetical protein